VYVIVIAITVKSRMGRIYRCGAVMHFCAVLLVSREHSPLWGALPWFRGRTCRVFIY
jgi:hypothetical protein